MPPRDRGSHLLRLIVGERGHMEFHGELILRFGYGAIVPWVTRIDDNTLRAIAGPDMVVLRSTVHLHGENFKTVGDFSVSAGEKVSFILSYALSHREAPDAVDAEAHLSATEKFWTGWAGKNQISSPWDEAVVRSLITLKALTFAPTGGMVAAPTTSLPECIGGPRNWDYRFCWLRDATLTLLALMNAGYYEEALMWRDWLLRAAAGSPKQIQIMYGIRGERRLTEWEVPWLPGYEKSKPVRIGNAAHNQLQLDIFGEVMDALHQARKGGLGTNEAGWDLQREFLAHLEKIWPESRRRYLGSARRAPAFHPLQGNGLVGFRPRRSRVPRSTICRARSIAGAIFATASITTFARTASMPSCAVSCSPMGRRSSMPACCCFRRSDFCRPRTRALSARSRRSSAG